MFSIPDARVKGKNEEKKYSIRKFEIGDWKADKTANAVIMIGYVRRIRVRMLRERMIAGKILMVLEWVIIMQTKRERSWAKVFMGVKMWFNIGYLL